MCIIISKKEKFRLTTLGFYGPAALAEWKVKHAEKVAMGGASNNDNESAVSPKKSSVKESSKDVPQQSQRSHKSGSVKESSNKEKTIEVDLGPPYDPLIPEQWLPLCMELSKLYVIKYKRIFQSLFYLLQYASREEICQPDTNNLQWKRCRGFMKANFENKDTKNIYTEMAKYEPYGPKTGEYKEYEKLFFI